MMSARDEPSGEFVGRILLDVPASDPVLGFGPIGTALASLIQTSDPRFAVGIFGSWGTGKSTLMDAIRSSIDPEHAVLVEFNAWRYERETHLILPLLDTIRQSLADWGQQHPAQGATAKQIAGRIGRVVRALARGVSVDVGLPGAATVSFDASKAMQDLSSGENDDATSAQSVYFAAFSELRAAFEQVNAAAISRIVVFVDDLDRCLPTSALVVIESMKLFFDMPGFVFVVGMDERVIERAVRVKFQEHAGAGPSVAESAIEREYVKKIFQVPYTLPAMAPGQLQELLDWMDEFGGLHETQRSDLRKRVRRYLRYVAVEGRINPREVKRFVNAYTLQRMIRPELDANTLLALQTLDFRQDWEAVYDTLLAEPDVFTDALRRYRMNEDRALENLWPELAVLPPELIEYLRSPEAEPLVMQQDLERYLSSLQSTRGAQSWLGDATRDIGQLRQIVRDIPPEISFSTPPARDVRSQIEVAVSRLSSYHRQAPELGTRLLPTLDRLHVELDVLSPSVRPPDELAEASTTPEQVAAWKERATGIIDRLQQELRLIRRASAFGEVDYGSSTSSA